MTSWYFHLENRKDKFRANLCPKIFFPQFFLIYVFPPNFFFPQFFFFIFFPQFFFFFKFFYFLFFLLYYYTETLTLGMECLQVVDVQFTGDIYKEYLIGDINIVPICSVFVVKYSLIFTYSYFSSFFGLLSFGI